MWPRPIIETPELAERLRHPTLRLLECTTIVTPLPDASDYRVESGRPLYDAGHIPGAVFVDLAAELSDPRSPHRFTMPPTGQIADVMGRHGVGPGAFVVAYCRAFNIFAARLWWMLRAVGFEDAAVLSGGFRKWTREGRPVSTQPGSYPAASFEAAPRPGLFVDKDVVSRSLRDPDVTVINALTTEQHQGRGGVAYGRPGHIPGSVSVPARELADPETHAYRPIPRLRELFASSGALDSERCITYCGAGIAASSDALVLTLLGARDVAVYDNSLQEWARDPSLPMETD